MSYWRALVLALALGAAQAHAARAEQDTAWPREPHACMEHAARYFSVPLPLLQAVRAQEAGRVGLVVPNLDGSFDYGPMQINSRWLPMLGRKGYTAEVLANEECANIVAGTWILAGELQRAGAYKRPQPDAQAFWKAVGSYHSRDPRRNRDYAEHVWRRYLKIKATERRTSERVGSVTAN